MNSIYLFMAVVAFFLVLFAWGYHRGLIRIGFSLAALVLALVITSILSPIVAQTLSKTALYDGLYQNVLKTVENTICTNRGGENVLLDQDMQDKILNKELNQKETESLYQDLDLSDQITDYLSQAQKQMKEMIPIKEIAQNIAKAITSFLMHIITYIVLFIVVNIILRLFIRILDLISKLPIINFFNRMGGGLIGIIEGLLIIWILCLIITAMGATWHADTLLTMIQENTFLKMIYDSNLLLKVIGLV